MRVLFLGTAAYEGHPNVFCDCENCRRRGWQEMKASGLRLPYIDDDLLIDFGPNIMSGAQKAGFLFLM
jgi:phosphoribosyl 1,2-cyclic phosphate phosphodiesterase